MSRGESLSLTPEENDYVRSMIKERRKNTAKKSKKTIEDKQNQASRALFSESETSPNKTKG